MMQDQKPTSGAKARFLKLLYGTPEGVPFQTEYMQPRIGFGCFQRFLSYRQAASSGSIRSSTLQIYFLGPVHCARDHLDFGMFILV